MTAAALVFWPSSSEPAVALALEEPVTKDKI
jgi:hypothetical protein